MTSLLCSSIIYGAKNGFLPIPNPVVSLSEKPCSSSENKKRCFCLSERTQLTAHTQCGFWTCLYFYIMLAKYCKFLVLCQFFFAGVWTQFSTAQFLCMINYHTRSFFSIFLHKKGIVHVVFFPKHNNQLKSFTRSQEYHLSDS